jgi:membrane dipeptidase
MKRVSFIILASFLLHTLNSFGQVNSSDLEKKVEKIHRRILTVDSHIDTPQRLMDKGFDISKRHDQQKDHSKVDFPRMREGGMDASFFAVFVSQDRRTQEGYFQAKLRADALFNSIYAVLARFPEEAGLAISPADAYRLKKHGKRAIFIGMENGYPIGNDLSLIQIYYSKGARYITLCHTRNNDICDSSTDSTENNGLSEFGRSVVKFMNKIGMMVDVSHISDKSFYDVIALSKAPVIASHSCARALCDNPRNMDDDMLRTLAKNGGVIQVCFLNAYVKKHDPNTATVSDVVDHIDHIVRVAGINHVGIGSDFDGGGGVIGCSDVSQMKNITLELLKRGYTIRDIRKIWGENLMRVMKKVSKISRKLNPPCNC